ncbi:MAG: thiol-disulfide oxidoreductase DCC family protein [Candidatus Methylomirabilales bacterium]
MARWVHRHDRRNQLELVPFQQPDLEERFPGISRERCRDELHLIDEQGHFLTGATAVRETLARLPRGSLRTLPFHAPGGMWLATQVYHWVARNRTWLSIWFS